MQKLLREDPQGAAVALDDVQRVIASEQRDFRFFIQELKPQAGPRRTLQSRLTDLATRMEREWDLRVDVHLDLGDRAVPDGLARDVYLLVREGLVNAVRHGGATVANVNLARHVPDGLAVSIADNGRGFDFVGAYTADELTRLQIGPRTLCERVLSLHGSLTLESGPAGAQLQMVLPGAA